MVMLLTPAPASNYSLGTGMNWVGGREAQRRGKKFWKGGEGFGRALGRESDPRAEKG